jgi:hypothetical protein
MRWGSHEIMSFDIRMAIRAALQNCDDYHFEAFGPTDSPDLPVGAEVAYFPYSGVAMVATNSCADYFDVPPGWSISLSAVLDLVNDPNR